SGWFWKLLVRIILTGPGIKITVRDQSSKDLLIQMGVNVKKIHVTADPVFLYSMGTTPKDRYAAQNPAAVLITRFPCPPGGYGTFDRIAKILYEEKSMEVHRLFFHPSMERISLHIPESDYIVPERDILSGLSLEETADQVGRFDLVVSARYHGLVLAAVA